LHERFWSGLCNHFEQIRVEPSGLSTYQISIVPTLWLLTQRKNHRMFQQMSEPDIVLEVLKDWNIEPEVRIDRGAYKKRKYRVQYAESDFAFISRMLEDAGITFYFEQVGEETKVILSDAPQSNEKRVLPLLFMDEATTTRNRDAGIVTGLRMQQRVRPGKYTLQDHDYRRPPSYKLVSSASGGSGIEDKLERYDYSPGAFLFGTSQGDASPVADDKGKTRTDEKEAAILAQKRLDAKRGSARVCTFETTANDLAPGVVIRVVGHPHGALGDGRALLVVESSLSGTDQGEWRHHCEARGTEVPFRPDSATPRPKVNGVESATVVGPKGEEIHTDEFGRVRVHFHWDRESQMDENSSCWIHVSQSWGGAGYGGSNLPRLGQEVLVDFLGGDPDRPVIVGRMYTNLQKTPYSLPLNKTQSGWKSNSTGGGGGYNELMFEDAGGQELLNIQAQKDLKKLVKNNESVTIGNNRTKFVSANDSVTVGANRTHRVQLNEQVSVGMNQRISVGINRSTHVGAIDSTTVGDVHIVKISPPGEDGEGGGHTTALMQHQKIVLDTGAGATITMEGSTIRITAKDIWVSDTFSGSPGGTSAPGAALSPSSRGR
jgi:type VI secretion system secreted protein VgrG